MATAKKRVPAKKAATKKAKKVSPPDVQVSFEEDIPSIKREGRSRTSKYDELLEKVKEKAQSGTGKTVAVLSFTEQGAATSRYTSLKSAVEKREDVDHWTVATRRHADDDIRLYIKWNDEAQTEDDE